MDFIKIFTIYYLISGILNFVLAWYDIHYANTIEAEDMIADVTWNTGVSRKLVRYLIYALSLLLGFILLPLELCSSLLRKGD